MHYWKIKKRPFRNSFCGQTFAFGLLVFTAYCWAEDAGWTSEGRQTRQTSETNVRKLKDAQQTTVTVATHPERIVTLAPSLGELAADLMADHLEKIVGVSEYTDYPPGLKSVASIGPYNQFNVEKILSLKPDVVLATTDGNPKDKVVHLRELGVPVVVVNTGNFSEIEGSIRLVADALGVPDLGKQMALQLKTGIARLKEKSKNHLPTRVMLQISDDPLYVAGSKTFMQDALDILGAKNIYGDADTHYPRPSLEDVMRRDPDMIIIIGMGEDQKTTLKIAAKWELYKTLRAVKSHRVRILQTDTLLRPTLRILEGLSMLNQVIYGSEKQENAQK
jgi:iron complex transport system substrate-binding protein